MANSHPDVRGIEHVGITVPNLEEATKYFADVLGAVFVYDVLKEPDFGDDLERTLGVPKGSVVKQVRLLRLGGGGIEAGGRGLVAAVDHQVYPVETEVFFHDPAHVGVGDDQA